MGCVSFRFWDDCVNLLDLEAMWMDPNVSAEWVSVGETKGSKVHLSRNPDGQPYLTQTEMKAVSSIIVGRHFVSQIDSDMLCAIAELESGKQPLAMQYNKKTKEVTMGLMQLSQKTAEWIVSEMGFRIYDVAENSTMLYKPFVNVYLGAAYLKWLSCHDQKERSEEFMVRAYKGGVKKAAHKSTLGYWKRYLSVKESLPSRLFLPLHARPLASLALQFSACPPVTFLAFDNFIKSLQIKGIQSEVAVLLRLVNFARAHLWKCNSKQI